MSPPGRPKGEHRSAQHEGSQVPQLHNPGRRTWLLTASAGLTVGFFAGFSQPGIPKRPAPKTRRAGCGMPAVPTRWYRARHPLASG